MAPPIAIPIISGVLSFFSLESDESPMDVDVGDGPDSVREPGEGVEPVVPRGDSMSEIELASKI